MRAQTEVLLEGLRFPEGPRWHEGRLWFSDMHAQRVIAVGLDGKLSGVATYHCNDMVVDAAGRAYVGNFGFDLHSGASPSSADLALVHPDGRVEVAARDLRFPNGTVITPDGRTLVVAESFGARLTAFDVAEDGSLHGRREWAALERAVPDGICLDAEDAIWVASPVGHQVLRVREGGEVIHRIPIENEAFACMLGGTEGCTLFICTAAGSDPAETHTRAGRIEMVEVEVPRAGLP